jgi:type I site-specific restriction endonuclease
MQKSEARILEMLVRVRQWILSRIAAFPDGSRGRELFDAVNTLIGKMETHAATQSLHAHASKEKTAQRRAADEALHKLLEAINRTARSMSRSMPGVEEKFRLPSNKHGQTWLATARAFVLEAEPLKDEFIKRSMAPDFIDDLKARILAVEQYQDGQAQQSAGRVTSTANVAEAAEQGLEAVRELDAIVRNIYADNEAELAAWESASHVERAPRRARTETPTAGPAPTNTDK